MKLEVKGKKYTLTFSSLAVENIEERFDKSIYEIFETASTLRAKDINFMLWAMVEEDMTEEQFKKEVASAMGYNELVKIFYEAMGIPNELLADEAKAIDAKSSKHLQG